MPRRLFSLWITLCQFFITTIVWRSEQSLCHANLEVAVTRTTFEKGTTMRRNQTFLLVAAAVAFMVSPVWAQESASPGQLVPTWVAWKVFYDSLDFYGKKSPQQDTKIVSVQFRLAPSQSTALLSSGRSFVAEIQRIDTEARTEAAKRYKYVPNQSGKPAPNAALTRPPVPQKSIQERAMADGFAAEVEAKKRISLTNHLNELERTIGTTNLQQIKTFVETSIASKIKSAPTPDLKSSGNPGLPPGVTRETPVTPATTR